MATKSVKTGLSPYVPGTGTAHRARRCVCAQSFWDKCLASMVRSGLLDNVSLYIPGGALGMSPVKGVNGDVWFSSPERVWANREGMCKIDQGTVTRGLSDQMAILTKGFVAD